MSILNSLPLTRIKIFVAKILYKIISPLYKDKHRKIVREGINYEVDLSEGVDLSLFLFGNFQSHVTHSKYLNIEDSDIVFDIGANFGIMSLQFAKAAPKAKVYAFEPTHYALKRFKKNLSLNPELAKRIIPVNTFISAKTEANADIKAFSSWKVDAKENASELHPVHLGTAKGTEGVASITLNDFCLQNSIPKIDFIKIDTDGHEYEILKGAKDVISKFRPKIIFEIGLYVMEEKGIDFSFYANYFGSLNYKLIDSKTGENIDIKNYKKIIPQKGTIDILALPID